jgi:hypothetical protein
LAVLLVLAAAGYGWGLVGYDGRAGDSAGAEKATQIKGPPIAEAPAALRKARLAAARKAFDKVWGQYRRGLRDEEQVYRWSVRWLEAERAVAAKQAGRMTALEGHLRRMKELEKTAPDRLVAVDPAPLIGRENLNRKLLKDKEGRVVLMSVEDINSGDAAVLAAYYRAEAEVWLAEAKTRGPQ